LDRITLEDLNLLTQTGFTESNFSNLLLNGAFVIEFDGFLRTSLLKLLDMEKFNKNLAQFLTNIASGNLKPDQLLKLEREHRLRFETTRQSVLEYFKSWDSINHLLGNLETFQIDSLAAVKSALDDYKRHDKVLAFTNNVMVFIQRMNPTTIVDFSSPCFFVLEEVQNLTLKYRAEQKTEKPVNGTELKHGESIS
jgi:hypothetical protein